MKKNYILTTILTLTLCLGFGLTAKAATTIFSDGFEASTFSAGGWNLSPDTGNNKWRNDASDYYDGSKAAVVTDDTGSNADYLLKKISTVGYNNVTIEFWYKVAEEISGTDDWVEVRWKTNDQGNWQSLSGTKIQNETVGNWKKITATFPSGANNNSNFQFGFAGHLIKNGGQDKDEVRIDAVTLTGTSMVVNTAPVAADLRVETDENVATSSRVTAGDSDIPAQTLTYSVVSNPLNGLISAFSALTGDFTYTPKTDYYGSDSFTFKANDGTTDSNVATVSITINQVNVPVSGCTDQTANNYNPNATVDDGSCTYTILGCMDPEATNYDEHANQSDGSCTYPILGCTDQAAINYNQNATEDDNSCIYPVPGCMDPEATNYNSGATVSDNSCTYPPEDIYGCTDQTATNYNLNATEDDGSCTYPILGCMDPEATNYNENANESDGSCTYPVPGCTDETAINYDQNATEDDGSCSYTSVVLGCTNPEATNYNENATQGNPDAESCTFSTNIIIGCTDQSANNYNPDATEDTNPTSCTYDQSQEQTTVIEETGSTSHSGSRHHSSGGGSTSGGEVLGASTCSPYLNEYIKFGGQNSSEEVTKLQTFLNEYMGANLSVNGVYDQATYNAVNNFQLLFKENVLDPWTAAGLKTENPTGYVYKTTQRWINILKCPELILYTPIPSLP